MNVWVKSGHVNKVPVNAAAVTSTTTGTGNAIYKDAPKTTLQVIVAGTGAVSATGCSTPRTTAPTGAVQPSVR